jgi:hypothetical protein
MNDEQRACVLAARKLPEILAAYNAADEQLKPALAALKAQRAKLEALPADAPPSVRAQVLADVASAEAAVAPARAALEALAGPLRVAQVATGWAQNPEALARHARLLIAKATEAVSFAELDGSDPALVARLRDKLAEAQTGLQWAQGRVEQVRAAEQAARRQV